MAAISRARQAEAHLGYVLKQARDVFLRANLGNAHAEELLAGIAVVLDGRIVDLQKLQGFQVIDPHGLRIVSEEHAETGVVLAQVLALRRDSCYSGNSVRLRKALLLRHHYRQPRPGAASYSLLTTPAKSRR